MSYRPPRDRARDVERAQELRKLLPTVTAVAREMGLPRSTVSMFLRFPNRGDEYKQRVERGGRQFKVCFCGRRKSYGASQCISCRRD